MELKNWKPCSSKSQLVVNGALLQPEDWIRDVEINRLVVQVFEDRGRNGGEEGFERDDFSIMFQLGSGFVEKIDRIFQVMKNVGKRNDIQTLVPDWVEPINRMAIEGIIEVIQFHDIAG